MSEKYIPLYRKYRPNNLQQVVGQEHVRHALENAISLNKISHAYLFTGPRGTGKTSIARILAKSLNCKEGPTLSPCGVCPSCIDITNSTPMDVIEIDAASNRKVEDARNILEKIQYIPTNGKYKIYIIDEVHMLTKEAFNTLLKTLEEPPENVIFILATTEPQKVLETITSRCQRFDFRRITTDDIIRHLKKIAEAEKIKINDEALFTIAKNASGSMRDSLALLDQVSVLGSSDITSDDVNNLLGRLSFDMLNNLSEFIIQSEPQEAIKFLEQVYNSGNEPVQILTNLLGYLKNLLIVKNCAEEELLTDLTQLTDNQIKSLKTQSENIDTHQITFLIEKTSGYIKELKTTTNQHLWLEIAVIDLANLAQNTSLLKLQERISRLEALVSEQSPAAAPKISIPPAPAPKQEPEIKKEVTEIKVQKTQMETEQKTPVLPQDTVAKELPNQENNQDIYQLWIQLMQNISSPPTVALLSEHARPVEMSDEKIVIGCEKEIFVKMLSDDTKKKVIAQAAKKLFDKDVNLIIRLAGFEEIPAAEKKNPPLKQPDKPEIIDEEPDEINEENGFIENELAKKKEEKFIPSDQVSMVMNLFDGKYIE